MRHGADRAPRLDAASRTAPVSRRAGTLLKSRHSHTQRRADGHVTPPCTRSGDSTSSAHRATIYGRQQLFTRDYVGLTITMNIIDDAAASSATKLTAARLLTPAAAPRHDNSASRDSACWRVQKIGRRAPAHTGGTTVYADIEIIIVVAKRQSIIVWKKTRH